MQTAFCSIQNLLFKPCRMAFVFCVLLMAGGCRETPALFWDNDPPESSGTVPVSSDAMLNGENGEGDQIPDKEKNTTENPEVLSANEDPSSRSEIQSSGPDEILPERDFEAIRKSTVDMIEKKDWGNLRFLTQELEKDPRTPPDLLYDLYFQQAEALKSAGAYDEAAGFYSKILNLPILSARGSGIRLARAEAFYRGSQAKKAADDCELLILQEDFPLDIRVRAFALYESVLNKDKSLDRSKMVELGECLLRSELDVPAREQILTQLCREAVVQQKDDALLKFAQLMLYDTGLTNRQRIEAAGKAAMVYILKNDVENAERMVRIPLSFLNLKGQDLYMTYEVYGKCASWQENCDEAVKRYREILLQDDSEAAVKYVNNLVKKEYMYFGRYADAAQAMEEAGDFLALADVYWTEGSLQKARESAMKVLSNENESLRNRQQALRYFMTGTLEDRLVRKKYAQALTESGDFDWNTFWGGNWRQGGLQRFLQEGNYESALEMAEICARHPKGKDNFDLVKSHLTALAGLQHSRDGAAYADQWCAHETFTPAQRYELCLIKAMFLSGDSDQAFLARYKALNKSFPDISRVTPEEREAGLVAAGNLALRAGRNSLVEEIDSVRKSLYAPQKKQHIYVPYSPVVIQEVADWYTVPLLPAFQKMERRFGGNMDFLQTDVSTGDRGSGIGTETDIPVDDRVPEFCALTDEFGIHFLLRMWDSEARSVQLGMKNSGSYEIYLSTGEGQPYYCFLVNPGQNTISCWNSVYTSEYHRRLYPESPELRCESKFFEDRYETELFISWDVFYDKLPEKGDILDFECIAWLPAGGFCWNGTKSIHGRSTWGELEFNLTAEQILSIQKNIIFKALRKYESEKRITGDHLGAAARWRNPGTGDMDFYKKTVQPLEEKLDDYASLVKQDMDAETVRLLYREAVPYWNGLEFRLSDLRRKYLMDQLMTPPGGSSAQKK